MQVLFFSFHQSKSVELLEMCTFITHNNMLSSIQKEIRAQE